MGGSGTPFLAATAAFVFPGCPGPVGEGVTEAKCAENFESFICPSRLGDPGDLLGVAEQLGDRLPCTPLKASQFSSKLRRATFHPRDGFEAGQWLQWAV